MPAAGPVVSILVISAPLHKGALFQVEAEGHAVQDRNAQEHQQQREGLCSFPADLKPEPCDRHQHDVQDHRDDGQQRRERHRPLKRAIQPDLSRRQIEMRRLDVRVRRDIMESAKQRPDWIRHARPWARSGLQKAAAAPG